MVFEKALNMKNRAKNMELGNEQSGPDSLRRKDKFLLELARLRFKTIQSRTPMLH